MYNKLKLLGICLLLCGCKKQNVENTEITNKELINKNVSTQKLKNEIPLKIQKYFNENQKKWSVIDENNFNKDLLNFLTDKSKYEKNKFCPYMLYGDFTNDGNEDFAIIVKDKKESDKDNNFALLIFNNYLNEFPLPHIVIREENYKGGLINSVIYSREEYGILSYIEKGNICSINIIDINYFEKSGFLVYWNKEDGNYHFLNHLDDNLCTIINNESPTTTVFNNWVNHDSYMLEIQITDTKEIAYIFHQQCVYGFNANVLNNKEVELIWGETGIDCVYDVFFNETFDLPKDKIPQKGKPFSKYILDNGVLKVSYYYEEWVERYKKKMTEDGKPFPFLKSFKLKTE